MCRTRIRLGVCVSSAGGGFLFSLSLPRANTCLDHYLGNAFSTLMTIFTILTTHALSLYDTIVALFDLIIRSGDRSCFAGVMA